MIWCDEQCIPAQFIRNHKMKKTFKVGLRVGNRTWYVTLAHSSKFKYHRLSCGWSRFMHGCKLNIGDVCNFELVDEEKFIFEVSFVVICVDWVVLFAMFIICLTSCYCVQLSYSDYMYCEWCWSSVNFIFNSFYLFFYL